MAVFRPKKFGNHLDKQQPYFPLPAPLSEQPAWDEYNDEMAIVRSEVIDHLFVHYKISAQNPNKWQALAFELAEHFVPAMQFQSRRGRGAADNWTWGELEELCKIVDAAREASGKPHNKVTFPAIRKQLAGTKIEKRAAKVSNKRLENLYYSFKKKPDHRLLAEEVERILQKKWNIESPVIFSEMED